LDGTRYHVVHGRERVAVGRAHGVGWRVFQQQTVVAGFEEESPESGPHTIIGVALAEHATRL